MSYNYGAPAGGGYGGGNQGYGGGNPGGYGGGSGVPSGYGQGPPPSQGRPGGPPGQGGPGGPGGFARTGPPPPPNGYDPVEWQNLWTWFNAVDTDHSQSIKPQELQVALRNGNWTQFDLDTVKMLMSIFDTNNDGTIGFNEFAGLWKYIKDWQNVYNHFDRDRSGEIDGVELQAALTQFGFPLSPQLILLVARKYEIKATHTASGAPPMPGANITATLKTLNVSFDRFIRACVFIKQLTESFRQIDTDNDGWVQINYETFMEIVLKGP